jgi:chromatin licensing and DNA replication factor 1
MIERPKTEPEKHNLPQLVNLIHRVFHSTNRTVITKEELLYKIIANQINITDRREVEEQLSLMLQLVPDWISETKASSGDLLVRINKMSTAETVRARLEEATSHDISLIY